MGKEIAAMSPGNNSDQKALKVVLFVIVAFACLAGLVIGIFAGWKAAVIAVFLLMLPAATIYRSSGIKESSTKKRK
ncbi:hypothetical protein [Noviherbaspirillum malthae]|uniref:hypothetical protein n=1 Tax=Noviherbaspirillum malthae TaxID=1260987 RepID=UPI001E5025AB|nr:hypothetical protein [Noviherbaspirillum malthae]